MKHLNILGYKKGILVVSQNTTIMDYEKPIRFDDDSIFSFINNYDIEDVNDIIRIVQDKKTPSFEKKVFNSLLKNYYRSLEEMN